MQSISTRYSDAYGFTRFLNNVGAAVQYAGLSFGSLLWLGSAASMTILPVPIAERFGNEAALVVPIVAAAMGIAAGTVIGVALYVCGVLIAAHAQILTATLDTAVNSSHVLSDDDRARILSQPPAAATVPPLLLPMPGVAAQSH